ncbi:family 10 glycosylhydrolase [Rufibacter sediminis]|uniref:Family 10 glycosylhydrolase n=1 Tax=Rufibacter sediminis TaxID=2762756 RepID=A0ABR6VQN6_9BACT|nr:family 10 glycosylhydrolase [Rufibacter sediminis]MBC3539199.1 family 10 glycosylhydrolase [Rufibacter sediminis]
MRKHLLTVLLLCLLHVGVQAQAPKREFRGAWIATYANIDWPNRSQTPAQQQAALISILNHHQATGINAIFLQVRSQSDALYLSNLEPISADLNGVQGRPSSPAWDPLRFALEESHKRGMELHAWINPYRAIANVNGLSAFAENHVAKQHPDWLIASGTLRTLDPGLPQVRDHILTVIADIVERYDLDGIHFDDYFYPNAAFNDDATYNAYSRGIADRADWRRDNVNLLIQRVHDTIEVLKPWVKFGVSPSGIYRNSTNPAIGTNTSGLQHYVSLYADSRKWLQEGWVDYLAPQVYWFIGQGGANYSVIVPWWNNNAYGRHIYIGLAGYKVNDPAQGANWANPSQIPNQVRLNRSLPNVYGQAIYNTSSLRSTTKLGFRDSLRTNFYAKPALLPNMPWRDNTPPPAPAGLVASRFSPDSVSLAWSPAPASSAEVDKVVRYVVYRSESPAFDITNAEQLLAITPTATNSFRDKVPDAAKTYYYVVTAVDRFHNESAPSNVTDYTAPVLACLAPQTLALSASCAAQVPDYTSLISVTDDVSADSAITWQQSPAAGTLVSGVGTFSVTITATDASGKSASCTFSVEKQDVTAPTFMLAVAQNVSLQSNCELVVPDFITGLTGTDNCGQITFTQSPEAGTVLASGHGQKHVVTITAQDGNGNFSERTVTLNALDTTPPTLFTQHITRTLRNGTVTITAAEVNNGSYDNCALDEASFTLSQSTFTCANLGENTVTFTAMDENGNQASVSATITIVGAIPAPAIAVSRQDQTYTGLPANTIALGYGAQSLTLTATNGTSAPGLTTYTWTSAAGLSTTTGGTTVFTPSAAGTYTFTVQATNEYGCSETTQVTVEVIDVRCGNKGDKVQVCHATGNNGANVLCIAPAAVPAHLKNGGSLGTCGLAASQTQAAVAVAPVLTAFPNPFEDQLTVSFTLDTPEQNVSLELFDLYGQKVQHVYTGSVEANRTYSFQLDPHPLSGKFYFVRLVTPTKVHTFKLSRK